MRKWGVYLVILGIGSFILPMMGLQFKILTLLGEGTTVGGIILAVIGLVMIIFGKDKGAASPAALQEEQKLLESELAILKPYSREILEAMAKVSSKEEAERIAETFAEKASVRKVTVAGYMQSLAKAVQAKAAAKV